MRDYGFMSMYFFVGTYILMAFDFVFNHDGILIVMMIMMGVGTFFGIKWIIVKRKVEKYESINPILS